VFQVARRGARRELDAGLERRRKELVRSRRTPATADPDGLVGYEVVTAVDDDELAKRSGHRAG
jgi:hypothetical protein